MNKKITISLMLGLILSGAVSIGAQTNVSSPTETKAGSSALSRPRPNYRDKFMVDKLYYYMIDESQKTVGVAPCNGVGDDMYRDNMEIPSTITYKGITYTVTEIGPAAFFCCFDLEEIKIPLTVKYIGDRAFWGTWLKAINIPDGVEEIGDYCFSKILPATSLTIGKGLKKAGKDPFVECYDLESITVDPENTLYSNHDGALYTKDMKEVVKYPGYRKSVTSVVLPSTVERLATGAFEYCEYLTELTLNEGLKEIGAKAFHKCFGLKTLRIPSTVEKIADGSAFILMSGCKQFEVAEGNKRFETILDGRGLVDKTEKKLVSLLYTKDTAPIKIPEGIEAIGAKAMMVLYENKYVEKDYRGYGAYSYELPSTLKTIGAYAFSGTNIRSIKIPDGVETIPCGCFDDCQKLSFVSFGKGCKNIDDAVFNLCETMESSSESVLRVYAEEPPKLLMDEDDEYVEPFSDKMVRKTQLQVPSGSLAKYKDDKAVGWCDFLKVVQLEGQAAEDVQTSVPSIISRLGALTIVTPQASPIAIYSLDGIKLYTSTQPNFTVQLPEGFYLVTYMNKSYKVRVH